MFLPLTNSTVSFQTATNLSVFLIVALSVLTDLTSANLVQDKLKPMADLFREGLRDVTLLLDGDQFVEQISFMRARGNSFEAKKGNFKTDEVLVKEQQVSFKLFEFDLLHRLLEKVPIPQHEPQEELSIKVHRISDLVVLMLQPLAFWIRMPLHQSLGSQVWGCEKLNNDFQIDIDLFKLQKFLRKNHWYSATVTEKLEASNRCVKHQLNQVFQLKSIFYRYLNNADDLGYDFGDKFFHLTEAVNENCIELHVNLLKEVLEPIVVDNFDFSQIYAKEELERQKASEKASEKVNGEPQHSAKEGNEKQQQNEQSSNQSIDVPKPAAQDKNETEQDSTSVSPCACLNLHSSKLNPARRWHIHTKGHYDLTETEGNLTKKHVESSLEESSSGIIA